MEQAWLTAELVAGRSLETIARALGCHPSTVSYWARRYGLVSAYAPRHAARGGIPRAVLEALVTEGLTVRAIAARLDVSYATVQHWLRRYGMKTRRAARRARLPPKDGPPIVDATCHKHGVTRFGRRKDGYYRCLLCRSEAVVARRRAVKRVLVDEAGGACLLCGYDRSVAALQFHHVDRNTKTFELSGIGVTRSLRAARAEAAKCVLLCANCHAEVEAGVASVGARPTMLGERARPGSSQRSGVAQLADASDC